MSNMNRIVVVNIYLGHQPPYFDLFLRSCAANPRLDFLFFVDFAVGADIPPNVCFIRVTLDEIRHRIQSHFDFPVVLHSAYKLCDFRPAFGEIFAEEFSGYAWWGHCDFDMLFGDLSPVVAAAESGEYVKIFRRGHLTLYRNTPEINGIYRNTRAGLDYRNVFQLQRFCLFDETNGIDKIFAALNLPVYRAELIADITPRSPYLRMTAHKNKVGQYFVWRNGRLHCMDALGNAREYIYIHFQKRKMAEHYSGEGALPDEIMIDQFGLFDAQRATWIVRHLYPFLPNLAHLARYYFPRIARTLKRKMPNFGRLRPHERTAH